MATLSHRGEVNISYFSFFTSLISVHYRLIIIGNETYTRGQNLCSDLGFPFD